MAFQPLTILAGLMDTDILSALLMNDLVGWLIILALLGLSIVSATILFWMGGELKEAQQGTAAFLEEAADRSSTMAGLFLASRAHSASPLAVLTREIYVELDLADWFRGEHQDRTSLVRAVIDSTVDRVFAEEQHRLETGLHSLGLIVSLAPFLGLFGTVWGILGSFQAMGGGDASLAALAPGLSTALVTTIAGLMVAIPASVMHTILTSKSRSVLARLDEFAGRLEPLLQRELQKASGT